MRRKSETSRAITEVRTVLSRALAALYLLEKGPSEVIHKMDIETKTWTTSAEYDPDQDDMIRALYKVAGLLDRWS